MTQLDELWRTLQIGDKVRIVEIPPEFLRSGVGIHPETMEVYEKLIARRRAVRIAYFDDWGLPWIRCQFRSDDGRLEYHSLALNHGGLVKVRSR